MTEGGVGILSEFKVATAEMPRTIHVVTCNLCLMEEQEDDIQEHSFEGAME